MASTGDVKTPDIGKAAEDRAIEARKADAAKRKEQLRALYARVRQRLGQSRLSLEGQKPDTAYYFGNTNPDEMALYHSMGFTINKDPDVKGTLPRGADGTLQVGDAILLSIPLEEYRAIQEINRLKTEDDLDAAIEKLIETAKDANFPIFKT
jgi:hypothetical protein